MSFSSTWQGGSFVTEAKITRESLEKDFLKVEKELGRIPPSTHLEQYGLPPVAKFNQKFGSYRKFLQAIGRDVKLRAYTRKTDPKRFFYPKEYLKILSLINNEEHKFWVEFLVHTGMRINEARNVSVKDIEFEKGLILVTKPKRSLGRSGKERNLEMSTYLKNRTLSYIKSKNLGKNDNFNFPSTQYFDRMLKEYAKSADISDAHNFSAHNCRKTLETWCAAGLNVNPLPLSYFMGHSIDIAAMHYVGLSMLRQEDKTLIKTILDDLFNRGGKN
jgi:integrase